MGRNFKTNRVVCHDCGNDAELSHNAYYGQRKRLGFNVCHGCSAKRKSGAITTRLLEKYKDIPKNRDIIAIICPGCGEQRAIQRKTAKHQSGLCVECAVKKSRIDHKSSYDLAAAARRGNADFSSAVSNGIHTKVPAETRKQIGSNNAKKLWECEITRAKELERRQSQEHRDAMAAIWNRDGYRESRMLTLVDFVALAKSAHGDRYDYSDSKYESSLVKINIKCRVHGEFWQLPCDHTSHHHGCPQCSTVISSGHQVLIDMLRNDFAVEPIINDRTAIGPFELDLWLPNRSFAIEHHGLFWHSYDRPETARQRASHAMKASLASSRGIFLFQVFEHELRERYDIVRSMIGHRLLANKRISARVCEIVAVDTKRATAFHDENHLQGGRDSSVNFGLRLNGELVSVLSMSKHASHEYEIIRFSVKKNHAVIGGLSRLFKKAIEETKAATVLTYADRRYSNACGYLALGFALIGSTKPGYCYIKGNKVFSRQTFQKHKLANRLEKYDAKLSESTNMFKNGYRRLWDAGHLKLLWSAKRK